MLPGVDFADPAAEGKELFFVLKESGRCAVSEDGERNHMMLSKGLCVV
jgi:hypothetical protein